MTATPVRCRVAERRYLALVLGIALLLRLAAMIQFLELDRLFADERYYARTAASIVVGEGHPGSVRPPLQSFALAGFISLVGSDHTYVRAVQSLMSLLTPLLIFQVSARRFGTRAAFFSGLACAISPGLVHYSHFLWAASLNATLLALWIWLFDHFERRGRLWILAAGGGVLGLAALTREIWLYAALPVGVWLCMREGWRWRRAAPGMLCFGLALVVTVAPWILRNSRLHGDLVTISTNHWAPIGAGNVFPADDWYLGSSTLDRLRLFRASPPFEDEFACQAYWRGVALRRIAGEQPWWIFKKVIRNTAQLFKIKTQELRFITKGYFKPTRTNALILLVTDLLGYALTMIPAILGLWLVPDRRLKSLVVMTLFMWLGVCWVANAMPRFHVPILPLLLLYSGPLLARAVDRKSTPPWRFAGAAACVGIYIFLPLPLSIEYLGEFLSAVDRLRP